MMSQCASEDEEDVEVVMPESKKACAEPTPTVATLDELLHDERVVDAAIDADMRATITDLKMSKAHDEQMRLKFLVDMEEMRKDQEELRKSQQAGVVLLEMLAKRICSK